jgi:hypothetical protein
MAAITVHVPAPARTASTEACSLYNTLMSRGFTISSAGGTLSVSKPGWAPTQAARDQLTPLAPEIARILYLPDLSALGGVTLTEIRWKPDHTKPER